MSLWLWLTFCRRSPQPDDDGVHDDNIADGHPLVATHPTGDGAGTSQLVDCCCGTRPQALDNPTGSGGPLQVAHLPPPLRRGRPPTTHQSHQSKERRLTPTPSRRVGTGGHRQALTGGPYLSIEVGHTGLSKAHEHSTPPISEGGAYGHDGQRGEAGDEQEGADSAVHGSTSISGSLRAGCGGIRKRLSRRGFPCYY
jgi:hypothetical protein